MLTKFYKRVLYGTSKKLLRYRYDNTKDRTKLGLHILSNLQPNFKTVRFFLYRVCAAQKKLLAF